MCDHPIEQACECEEMATNEAARDESLQTQTGYECRGTLLNLLLSRLKNARKLLALNASDAEELLAKSEKERARRITAEEALLRKTTELAKVTAQRDEARRVAGAHFTKICELMATTDDRNRLHSELVQVRVDLGKMEEERNRLRAFVRDIATGYDCDTGANSSHPHCCRACCAEALLPKE